MLVGTFYLGCWQPAYIWQVSEELLKKVKNKLVGEIQELERELKEDLPQALKKALEMGDLRENAEYQTAKERQGFVQARLAQLLERLSKLSLINLSKIPNDRVSYGSTVLLLDLDTGSEVSYRLVTSEESDVGKGLISTASPIGKSLMGHEEGDEIQTRTPRGVKKYEIMKLTTLHESADQ